MLNHDETAQQVQDFADRRRYNWTAHTRVEVGPSTSLTHRSHALAYTTTTCCLVVTRGTAPSVGRARSINVQKPAIGTYDTTNAAVVEPIYSPIRPRTIVPTLAHVILPFRPTAENCSSAGFGAGRSAALICALSVNQIIARRSAMNDEGLRAAGAY